MRKPSPAELIEAHQQQLDADAIELASDEDALEFWDKIMRTRQPIQRRMRAAEMRAQYKYPRLGVVATTNLNADDFASMLDRAIQRSQVRVIEHEGAKPSPAPIPPHGTPRTGPVPDRRFRRA
jgi:hypothetical protein